MGYKAKNLAGGLLSGLGQGMMAQDKNRRDQAIKDRNTAIAALAADRAARSEGRAERKENRDIWSMTIKDFTTKTAGLNGATEVTDWESAAKDFDAGGYDDLAERARSRISNEIDRDSDEWLEIEMEVNKEKNRKDPVGPNSWRKGAMKKEFGDLTPDEWAEAEAERRYNEKYGTEATTTAATSGSFKTAIDVGEAYRNGQLSLKEAEKILKEKFGKT